MEKGWNRSRSRERKTCVRVLKVKPFSTQKRKCGVSQSNDFPRIQSLSKTELRFEYKLSTPKKILRTLPSQNGEVIKKQI